MAIIVADIHGDIEKTKAFLDYKPEEQHVALGDYLDSFIESPENQLECLQLLMESESILLLGNHECHYLKEPMFGFAGFNLEYAQKFQDVLEANIQRFKVAYATDGWLCTHAGVKSQFTELQSDVTGLADTFNNNWKSYLQNRLVVHRARYAYQSIFEFNYHFLVEGNLLAENINQIFGHMEHMRPIVEPTYIALDTTNHTNSCWVYDTSKNELVQLSLEAKIGRVRFHGGGWM
jgi:hypothetical protein